jgi:hypothetical protein
VKRVIQTATALGLLLVVVLVAKAFAPEAALYRDWLGEVVILRMGAVTKLFFLATATVFSHRIATSLEADNPARRAWRLLGLGLLGFLVGQSSLGFYQIVLGRASPYPSAGDVAFMAGYPFLLAAFWSFVHAYRESGLPVGSAREHLILAVVAGLGFAGVAAIVLRPILVASAPPLEKFLNTAYPAFDFLILIPLLILLRITLPFRGGQVWTIWAALLGGFACMCAGDILYAYFSSLGKTWLESLLDALFILAYVLIARATWKQLEAINA